MGNFKVLQQMSSQFEPRHRDASCNQATKLSLPMTDRMRDRIATLFIKWLVQFTASDQARFSSDGSMQRIINWLAFLYGIEFEQLLSNDCLRRSLWNLLSSVAQYGISSPQALKAPFSVVWSLSYRCNLRCMHCYQNAGQPSTDELSLDEQLNIVDQIAHAGVSMVVLSGGEPLANPNLEFLIERIRKHKMAISIDSNGVLVDKKIVEYLKRVGVTSIELSLDGAEAQSHDRFRGLDGAFNKTLDAVEMCAEAGIFTTVATTATRLNHTNGRKLIALAKSRGANRIVFFDLIPTGRGKDIQNLRLTPKELTDLMSLVRQESSKGIEVFTELPQFGVYSSIEKGETVSVRPETVLSLNRFTVSSFFDCAGRDNIYKKLAPYLGGCPAGRLYCNIQPNGDVTPCMFMPDHPVAGNLREQSFEEIWESETFRALRDRTLLKGKCRECMYRVVCGGCRAKAAAYSEDWLASDPTCPIQAR